MNLWLGNEFLGQASTTFGAAPSYGTPPSANQTSVLVAFTTNVEFDRIFFESSSTAFFGTESLWVPTSAIPSPGVVPMFALAAIAGRRRR